MYLQVCVTTLGMFRKESECHVLLISPRRVDIRGIRENLITELGKGRGYPSSHSSTVVDTLAWTCWLTTAWWCSARGSTGRCSRRPVEPWPGKGLGKQKRFGKVLGMLVAGSRG